MTWTIAHRGASSELPENTPAAFERAIGLGADFVEFDVHVAAEGAGPEDGFTGYTAFGFPRVARWGDYSAAAADDSGNLWLATEFIPNAPRAPLANWGTFIMRIVP